VELVNSREHPLLVRMGGDPFKDEKKPLWGFDKENNYGELQERKENCSLYLWRLRSINGDYNKWKRNF
jgi:hypothetical protein